MIKMTLPNGAVKEFAAASVTGREVAEAIGPRLAKDAIGAVVDGELRDLAAPITKDGTIAIVTAKAEDANALYLVRHSAAHVMAEAITRLFPQTKLAYGPPVEQGFYYDMELDHKLTEGDFVKIEEEIKKILAEDRAFTRYEMPFKDAIVKLQREGNKHKVDNACGADTSRTAEQRESLKHLSVDETAEYILKNTPAEKLPIISFYVTGEPGKNWEDLCRGPHVPSTGRIGAIKVMSVAGAYWHGDETKQQLQRVYGIAFPTQKELDAYLNQVEEAKKRDHRVIGKQMGLFTISPLVGSGLILWMPKGAIMRQELEQFMREELAKRDYLPVYTPHIGKVDLYKISGHYPYYQESQFPTIKMKERDSADESEYLLKPMNCPHHIQIYAAEPRSYRDLPVRLAEFGTVYRFEQSGELNGMTRVRGFTQDDAHLFCTPEQVEHEFRTTVEMVMHVFETLGFKDYECRVSLRDPESDKYVGEPANWDKAENMLRKVVKEVGIRAQEAKGEAAFYGPKIDFMVKDVIGRTWQLGTVQLDYNLPERFELEYIGADNARHRPVMIHRAPFGSMERFTGILIEHFAGAFPTWLSPTQAAVLTISEKFDEYAKGVLGKFTAAGVRAEIDLSGDKIGGKIRRAREAKIPYLLIVGAKEQEAGAVAVRTRKDKDLGAQPAGAFIEKLREEIRMRALPVE